MQTVVVGNHPGPLTEEEKEKGVRVQWDPERDARLGVLPYRSIQIGIQRGVGKVWTEGWICGIEDVTGKARALKKFLDENPKIDLTTLQEKGLMPLERVYPVDEELKEMLKMT